MVDTEWFQGKSTDEHDKSVVFNRVLLAVIVGIALALVVHTASAEPLYQAVSNDGKIVITLYSDSCSIPGVKNLPKKAVWRQDGKTYEGCAGLFETERMIAIYLDDHTVQLLPASLFAPVTSI